MLRPYFTVIKDSFDEALASRVLWILLAAATFVLLGLAPLSVEQQRATELRLENITNWPRLMQRLREEGGLVERSPSRRMVELAEPALRKQLGLPEELPATSPSPSNAPSPAEVQQPAAASSTTAAPASNTAAPASDPAAPASDPAAPASDPVAPDAAADPAENGAPAVELTAEIVEGVRKHLNAILKRRDFYQVDDWTAIELEDDLRELLSADRASLSDGDIAYLNWRLLKSAFPQETMRAPPEELHLVYFHWSVSPPLPLSRAMFTTALQQVVAAVMNFLVGTIAVFVAILVTAPLIPQTFEAGSIDLLLSKPVSRWLLFLAKFMGACAFILLLAGYFIVGLWLILGWRFEVWNHRLLYCIPIFMFLFLIYYAVSALAGVIWRNATVSIVVSILFWAVCFAVGLGNDLIERIYIAPQRIANLGWFGDTLLAVGNAGQISEWRGDHWQLAVNPPEARRGPPIPQRHVLLGPLRPGSADYVLSVPLQRRRGPLSFLESGPRLTVARSKSGAWEQTEGPTTPAGTSWMLGSPRGDALLVSKLGVHRIDSIEPSAEPRKILGFTLPAGSALSTLWTPADGPLEEPMAAAIDGSSGMLAIWSGGVLRTLQPAADGKYTEAQRATLDETKPPALLACGNQQILLATAQGSLMLTPASDLEQTTLVRAAGGREPYQLAATPDGQWFSVLYHDGELCLLNGKSAQLTRLDRDASAFTFRKNDQILVADRTDRVSTYDLATRGLVERRQGPRDFMQQLYYWGINPFYTLFPKPGELSEVVNYFLTSRQTMALGGPEVVDLRFQRETLNVRGALLNGAAFVAVVLTVTCLYIQRLDL